MRLMPRVMNHRKGVFVGKGFEQVILVKILLHGEHIAVLACFTVCHQGQAGVGIGGICTAHHVGQMLRLVFQPIIHFPRAAQAVPIAGVVGIQHGACPENPVIILALAERGNIIVKGLGFRVIIEVAVIPHAGGYIRHNLFADGTEFCIFLP